MVRGGANVNLHTARETEWSRPSETTTVKPGKKNEQWDQFQSSEMIEGIMASTQRFRASFMFITWATNAAQYPCEHRSPCEKQDELSLQSALLTLSSFVV